MHVKINVNSTSRASSICC